MSVSGTAGSAAHANSIDGEVDPAYQNSYIRFQERAPKEYQAARATLSSPNSYLGWLKYAAYVNTPAAYEFQGLAKIIHDLLGRHISRGKYANPGVPRDALDYIESYRQYVIDR